MTLYKGKYRIESARLPGWDYSSPGYYFITVSTHNRECLFGHIDNGKMNLNEYGTIVYDEWCKSFTIRRELLHDEFVVMPNHFHGIVQVIKTGDQFDTDTVETAGRPSLQHRAQRMEPEQRTQIRPKSISSFMAGVKSVITKRINEIRKTPGRPVLQLRFHDHIVRTDEELYRIRQYIRNNPSNWTCDKMNDSMANRVSEELQPYEEEPWMI